MLTVSPTDRIFILAGAGVSAESGIPTFRGVGGLWRNYRIEGVASPEAWHRDPRLAWEFYSMRRRVASEAAKNGCSRSIAISFVFLRGLDLLRRSSSRFSGLRRSCARKFADPSISSQHKLACPQRR